MANLAVCPQFSGDCLGSVTPLISRSLIQNAQQRMTEQAIIESRLSRYQEITAAW